MPGTIFDAMKRFNPPPTGSLGEEFVILSDIEKATIEPVDAGAWEVTDSLSPLRIGIRCLDETRTIALSDLLTEHARGNVRVCCASCEGRGYRESFVGLDDEGEARYEDQDCYCVFGDHLRELERAKLPPLDDSPILF